MGYRVTVDRDKCIGAANCVAAAPSAFELDEEGKAVVTDPEAEDEETLLRAAESCPTDAIILEDEETGQRIYPR